MFVSVCVHESVLVGRSEPLFHAHVVLQQTSQHKLSCRGMRVCLCMCACTTALNAAQAKLKDVQARIAELETTFARTQAQKEQLARDVEVCRARLVRAQKLVGGLGGEKDR